MTTRHAPEFALSFSSDAVHLLERAAPDAAPAAAPVFAAPPIAAASDRGWRERGAASFSAPDFRDAMSRLRAIAANGADAPVALIIPDDQILYTSLAVQGDGDGVGSALDGLTPYAVDELAWDWRPDSAGAGVRVAAVARQTLREAEEFARRHGFAPESFLADPAEGLFPAVPRFAAPRDVGAPDDLTDPADVAGDGDAPEDDPAVADAAPADAGGADEPDEAPATADIAPEDAASTAPAEGAAPQAAVASTEWSASAAEGTMPAGMAHEAVASATGEPEASERLDDPVEDRAGEDRAGEPARVTASPDDAAVDDSADDTAVQAGAPQEADAAEPLAASLQVSDAPATRPQEADAAGTDILAATMRDRDDAAQADLHAAEGPAAGPQDGTMVPAPSVGPVASAVSRPLRAALTAPAGPVPIRAQEAGVLSSAAAMPSPRHPGARGGIGALLVMLGALLLGLIVIWAFATGDSVPETPVSAPVAASGPVSSATAPVPPATSSPAQAEPVASAAPAAGNAARLSGEAGGRDAAAPGSTVAPPDSRASAPARVPAAESGVATAPRAPVPTNMPALSAPKLPARAVPVPAPVATSSAVPVGESGARAAPEPPAGSAPATRSAAAAAPGASGPLPGTTNSVPPAATAAPAPVGVTRLPAPSSPATVSAPAASSTPLPASPAGPSGPASAPEAPATPAAPADAPVSVGTRTLPQAAAPVPAAPAASEPAVPSQPSAAPSRSAVTGTGTEQRAAPVASTASREKASPAPTVQAPASPAARAAAAPVRSDAALNRSGRPPSPPRRSLPTRPETVSRADAPPAVPGGRDTAAPATAPAATGVVSSGRPAARPPIRSKATEARPVAEEPTRPATRAGTAARPKATDAAPSTAPAPAESGTPAPRPRPRPAIEEGSADESVTPADMTPDERVLADRLLAPLYAAHPQMRPLALPRPANASRFAQDRPSRRPIPPASPRATDASAIDAALEEAGAPSKKPRASRPDGKTGSDTAVASKPRKSSSKAKSDDGAGPAAGTDKDQADSRAGRPSQRPTRKAAADGKAASGDRPRPEDPAQGAVEEAIAEAVGKSRATPGGVALSGLKNPPLPTRKPARGADTTDDEAEATAAAVAARPPLDRPGPAAPADPPAASTPVERGPDPAVVPVIPPVAGAGAVDPQLAERRRLDQELQAQAEARVRARAAADAQAELQARAAAEARARAQAAAEERAAIAKRGEYRPPEVDDEPEVAVTKAKGTTTGSVAKAATVGGMDLGRTQVIGVIGAGRASRGLIRLRNGKIVTVRLGDRIDGGAINSIGNGRISYVKSGRQYMLPILNGR